MRLLRLVLISFIVLFLVTTFVFALFPSHIRISRVILIPASKEKLASFIGDFRTWNQWNQFTIDSSLTHKTISDPSAGKGAWLQSDQERVTMLTGGPDSIRCRWTQTNGRSFGGGFNILPMDANNSTVEWYFDFYFKWYPWEKMGSMFYDKQLGPIMEKSLITLKNYTGNP
jgi:Polyketide cyclase / dehydrase and lipid transport